jgi:hypothetical protein
MTTYGEVDEKINEVTPLKEHSMCVKWENIKTEQLMEFYGVILNKARHVKCSIKKFFCEQRISCIC